MEEQSGKHGERNHSEGIKKCGSREDSTHLSVRASRLKYHNNHWMDRQEYGAHGTKPSVCADRWTFVSLTLVGLKWLFLQ